MPVIPTHYLSPREVGELLGISDSTIRRLIRQNELQAIRMPPGNHFKITPAEVLRYVDANALPLAPVNRQHLEQLVAAGEQSESRTVRPSDG